MKYCIFCVLLNSAEEPKFPPFKLYPLLLLLSLQFLMQSPFWLSSRTPLGTERLLWDLHAVFSFLDWKNPISSAWRCSESLFLEWVSRQSLALAYPEVFTWKAGISYKLEYTTPHSRVSLSHKGIDIAIYMLTNTKNTSSTLARDLECAITFPLHFWNRVICTFVDILTL